jgi:hypothetical protein
MFQLQRIFHRNLVSSGLQVVTFLVVYVVVYIEHGHCDENTGAAPASLCFGSTRLREHFGTSLCIGLANPLRSSCDARNATFYNTAMVLIAISSFLSTGGSLKTDHTPFQERTYYILYL